MLCPLVVVARLEDLKVTIDRIASAMKAVTDNTDQAQRDIRG